MHPLDTSTIRLRVTLGDLDTNLHVNNGRYLTYLDLGRWDLTVRTGLGGLARKQKFYPVVATATTRFRRSLRFGQSFELHTKVLGWEEHNAYLYQWITHGDELIFTATVRAAFLNRSGKVSMQDIVAQLYPELASPELPPEVSAFNGSHLTPEGVLNED